MNKDPKLQEILAHQLYLMNAKDKGYNDLVKKIIQNQIRNTDEYLTAYAKYKKKTGELIWNILNKSLYKIHYDSSNNFCQ